MLYFADCYIFIIFATKLDDYEHYCWKKNGNRRVGATLLQRSLGIEGVKTSISAWVIKGDETKAGGQVDLLIMRDDNIVNLCEMKFTSTPYSVDKEEEAKMLYRVDLLKESLSARQRPHLTLITTYGLISGKHSGKVQKVVTCDDLFSK